MRLYHHDEITRIAGLVNLQKLTSIGFDGVTNMTTGINSDVMFCAGLCVCRVYALQSKYSVKQILTVGEQCGNPT